MDQVFDHTPAANPQAVTDEERHWAAGAHLAALVMALLTTWMAGLAGVVGAGGVYLLKRDSSEFVADQAKEALNFNITVSGIFVILLILSLLTLGIGFLVTAPIMLIIGIAALVFIIIAAMKANQGIAYRYPMTLRLVK